MRVFDRKFTYATKEYFSKMLANRKRYFFKAVTIGGERVPCLISQIYERSSQTCDCSACNGLTVLFTEIDSNVKYELMNNPAWR